MTELFSTYSDFGQSLQSLLLSFHLRFCHRCQFLKMEIKHFCIAILKGIRPVRVPALQYFYHGLGVSVISFRLTRDTFFPGESNYGSIVNFMGLTKQKKFLFFHNLISYMVSLIGCLNSHKIAF